MIKDTAGENRNLAAAAGPELRPETDGPSSAQFVHQVLHFVRVVRYRSPVLIGAVLVAFALGGLYYCTAPRRYQARSQLLITHTGGELWSTATTTHASRDMVPTYQRLFRSAKVVDGAIARLRKRDPQARVDFAGIAREKWSDILRENLAVSALRRTNIIQVVYTSKDPQAAVEVVDCVVQSYLSFMKEEHRDLAEELGEILDNQRTQLDHDLLQTEGQLLQAKQSLGDFGTGPGSQVPHPAITRVVKFNEAFLEAQARRYELESLLAVIQATREKGGNVRQYLTAVEPVVGSKVLLHSLGLSERDAVVSARLEQQLLEKRGELRGLQEHLGPNHPDVVEAAVATARLEQHLARMHARFQDELNNSQQIELGEVLTGLVREELNKARHHEEKLYGRFLAAEEKAVALGGELTKIAATERKLDLLRSLHEGLLNRITKIDMSQDKAAVRMAEVSRPTSDGRPVSPSGMLVFLLATFGGIGGGALIIFVLDVLDDRFRTPDEIVAQLRTQMLAIVRSLDPREAGGSDSLQVCADPAAVKSEAFRTLRTALAFRSEEVSRLVFTSAEAGDGKTTVVANLAASFAQAGQKTLLIDADMRRPGLTRLFDLRAESGLSQLLGNGQETTRDFASKVVRAGDAGFDILPCGPRPPDPAELLGNDRFAELLTWAETVYGQVLIDSPPLLAANDAALVGRLVDGAVLVVQPSKNHRRGVIRACEDLRRLGVTLVGVVLNRVGGEGDRSYYGDDPAYGYGYGDGYGEPEEETDAEHHGAGPIVLPIGDYRAEEQTLTGQTGGRRSAA